MLKIEIIDQAKILESLIDLPTEVQDKATEEINEYLLNVLRAYPPYKYVPFKNAYGGWFSDRQRRYVMARIREGSITPGRPNRSQNYANSWLKVGSGRGQYLENSTPYGIHLQSERQARMPGMIGWKKINTVFAERMAKIDRIIEEVFKKVTRRRGMK